MVHKIQSEHDHNDHYDLSSLAVRCAIPCALLSTLNLAVWVMERSREWLLSVLGAREVSEGANLTVIDAKSKAQPGHL
jgi:hypothetical protein